MVSSTLLLAGAVVLFATFRIVTGLHSNIRKARQSGLPYVVLPITPHNRWYQLTHKLWLPLIRRIPERYREHWLIFMQPGWNYRELLEPFRLLGGDSFLTVGPDGITMFTQDADVIRQVAARREDFPKMTSTYDILSGYGENVLTTEGPLWRMHRKVTSASFNEKNAAHTFSEAIHQSQGMLEQWKRQGNNTIKSIEHDTMVLALNIIGYVGFGLRFLWPHETMPEDTDPRLKKYGSLTPPDGHSMTFAQAMATVLERIIILLTCPRWLRRILPFESVKEAEEADTNYRQYMNEFLAEKIEDVKRGDRGEGGMDIMGQLVRSKYGEKTDKSGGLSDDEIIGNAFIMTVAGHETTANVLHFTLLQLATNPASQRRLQADIDRLFGDSDPSTWNYEQNVNAMLASMLGASMNEMLRLLPPVVNIPKEVSPTGNPVVTSHDGQKHALPVGMGISLSAVTVQRHPRFWPTQRSRLDGSPTDLDDFVPERWFRTGGDDDDDDDDVRGPKDAAAVAAAAGEDTEDYGGFSGPDTSAQLYRPYRGSFVPFSEGARSCLGRRIAQVEIIAALAVLFQHHSLELAVDDLDGGGGASDEQVARMPLAERAAVYQRAQERCRATVRGATSILTLKLHGNAYVPVRLVRRGEERFVGFVDA